MDNAKSDFQALNEYDSKCLLKKYNIPVIEEITVSRINQTVKAATQLGFPVVLKPLSDKILHKTERNLVYLNLQHDQAVFSAATKIADATENDIDGFLIQPFINGKREFVAGLFRDNQFGPVILFGVGGIYTEAFQDVTFRLAPITLEDAYEMLDEIKAKVIMNQFRGESAVNRQHLVDTLMGLSDLSLKHPDIAEIDINPLIVKPDGNVCAVDALVLKHKNAGTDEYLPSVAAKDLGVLFHPKSIAFVGASKTIGKWGHTLLVNTISGGYKGKIFLVNPNGIPIAGRDTYQSIIDLPQKVDLAIVTIPATKVMSLLDDLKSKGIKHVLLISSGFAEIGTKGKGMEKALIQKAAEEGLVILGPNTMGICNPHYNLYCTGVHVDLKPGSTSILSQSGNMGTQLLSFAEQQGIGIRCFCGSGNEAMVTIEDFLDAFSIDPLTKTVMLYVESVKNGRRFFEGAKKLSKTKPIVILKGGQTEAGHKAAASHTGAMSSDAKIFDAMCRQAGIVKVEQSMDLLDLSACFASLPLPKGNRTAIMTLGGGWGVVTADLCSKHGLIIPELSEGIIAKIDKILPPYWSRSNPIDLVGENDMTIPIKVMEMLLEWDGCDAVINLGIHGRQILTGKHVQAVANADPTYPKDFLEKVYERMVLFEKEYIRHIVQLMAKYEKPVYGVSLMTDEQTKTVYDVEDSEYKGIFFPSPERAVKAFLKMHAYQKFLDR